MKEDRYEIQKNKEEEYIQNIKSQLYDSLFRSTICILEQYSCCVTLFKKQQIIVIFNHNLIFENKTIFILI